MAKGRTEAPKETPRAGEREGDRGDAGGIQRLLELYCGIGGCAAAVASSGVRVVAALDVNRSALEVYTQNFDHPVSARTLEGLGADELAAFRADLWWLSPPCQPFTRRGLGRDADDPRSRSLLALLDRIGELGAAAPSRLALENVPGFAGSRCHARLLEVLAAAGYRVRERVLCPTELGVPNRRRRYYLAARRGADPAPWPAPPPGGPPLAAYLDPEGAETGSDLRLAPAIARRYRHALDVVDPADPSAVAACFTAAYGRSPVRSGSYLPAPGGGLRHFSPSEVLRLLGFPATFSLPPGMPPARAWPLLGNSLSVPAVRHVLSTLYDLPPP